MKIPKKTILVEFIGLPGSGKSTISDLLAENLRKDDIKIATRGTLKSKHKKLYYLGLVFMNPKKTLSLAYFSWKNRHLFYNPDSHNSYLKRIKRQYKIFKNLLIQNFMDLSLNQNIIFEGVFHHVCSWGQGVDINAPKILSVYPRDSLIFFSVETSPKIAYERMIYREKERNLESFNRTKYRMKIEYHNRHNAIKDELYQFLKKNEGKMRIKKVIRVDGEKPITENVDLLTKKLESIISIN